RLAVLAGREPSARREARREQFSGGRQRGLAVLTEASDPAGRADVLRQLEIEVLEVPTRADDRLAGAVRELQRRREADVRPVDVHDRRALLVAAVADQHGVAGRETGAV